MVKEQNIYLWHDCLDCGDMYGEHCPLEGEDELEKINNRISKPDDFQCAIFLRKRKELKSTPGS